MLTSADEGLENNINDAQSTSCLSMFRTFSDNKKINTTIQVGNDSCVLYVSRLIAYGRKKLEMHFFSLNKYKFIACHALPHRKRKKTSFAFGRVFQCIE